MHNGAMSRTPTAVPGSFLPTAARALAIAVLVSGLVDQACRQILRRSLTQAVGLPFSPAPLAVLAAVVLAGVVLVWLWRRRGIDRLVATTLVLLFVGGMFAQRELGARLQSDGLRYYAYFRSLAFDHDVNLVNDYHLLGLDNDRAMAALTPSGHLPSPFQSALPLPGCRR